MPSASMSRRVASARISRRFGRFSRSRQRMSALLYAHSWRSSTLSHLSGMSSHSAGSDPSPGRSLVAPSERGHHSIEEFHQDVGELAAGVPVGDGAEADGRPLRDLAPRNGENVVDTAGGVVDLPI